LSGGDDLQGPGRDGVGLDAVAGVRGDEVVVDSAGQHGAEDHFEHPAVGRGEFGGFEHGQPLPDGDRGDVDHAPVPEERHEVGVEGVGVALARGLLDRMVRQPILLGVLPEEDLAVRERSVGPNDMGWPLWTVVCASDLGNRSR
jgi:hypothetical protein